MPVAEILVKNGADVNSITKAGYTPLHIASHYGQANMVRFLLGNGANVGATTTLCYTSLHQAAQQGHTNIVNILLEHKADADVITTVIHSNNKRDCFFMVIVIFTEWSDTFRYCPKIGLHYSH